MLVLNLLFAMMQIANAHGFKAVLSSESNNEVIHSELSVPIVVEGNNQVELIVRYQKFPPKDFIKNVILEEKMAPDKDYSTELFSYEIRQSQNNCNINFWDGHWMGHIMKTHPNILYVNQTYAIAAFNWAMQKVQQKRNQTEGLIP